MKVCVPKREATACMCRMGARLWAVVARLGRVDGVERVAQFAPDETLTLYGRDGTLAYNFTRDEVWGARRGDRELCQLTIPAELITEWTVERDFIQAVSRGSRPEPSFETGVRYLEFIEAVNLFGAGRPPGRIAAA